MINHLQKQKDLPVPFGVAEFLPDPGSGPCLRIAEMMAVEI